MPIATAAPALDRLRLSDSAPGNVQSEIRAMSVACAAAGGINMAQGVCDTDVPHPVAEAAIEAICAGHNIYTRLDGLASLRHEIAQKFASFNGLTVDPDTEVLVTSGATGALHAALLALLNPGDECIVFQPFYGYHVATLRSQRVMPIIVPLEAPDWALDFNRLRAAITPRTRGLILNTPANPSGKVFTAPELEALAALAIEHDLFVFTDEMYEYFLFDEARHRSIATLPGMAERTVTISGFSKTFSVTGWRLGYLAADPRWIPAIGYFHDLTYVCAPAPLQHGAAAGLLRLPASFYDDLATDYERKRDALCASLTRAGLTPCIPTGAYYVLADATAIPGADSKAKARKLLADTGIAAVSGSAFFMTNNGHNEGDHLLRFCFAKKDAELAEACRRLDEYKPLSSPTRHRSVRSEGPPHSAFSCNDFRGIRCHQPNEDWQKRRRSIPSAFVHSVTRPSLKSTRNARDQHDLISIRKRVCLSPQKPNVFIVHIYVDEAPQLARIVLHILRQRRIARVEVLQQRLQIRRLGGEASLPLGMPRQRRR